MAEGKVSLKLLIDSKSKKVLFAEAGKEFVDFLLNILSLPLATVVKILTKKAMVGCLGDLCKSVESINSDFMQPNVNKDTVLQPTVTVGNNVKVSLMSFTDTPTAVKTVYRCAPSSRYNSGCNNYYTDVSGASCPNCGREMRNQMSYVQPGISTEAVSSSINTAGGYVKGVVTYMVMDNLEVKPMSTISGITLMNKFNVKDVAALVEKEVHIGLAEGVALLKASLQTKAVLTSVFL